MIPGSAGLLAVMDEKSLVPLCPVGVCGGWGGQWQWLQMTSALLLSQQLMTADPVRCYQYNLG